MNQCSVYLLVSILQENNNPLNKKNDEKEIHD
jgi:hypothetical protein